MLPFPKQHKVIFVMFTSWFITKAQRKLFYVRIILINVSGLTVGHGNSVLTTSVQICTVKTREQIDALIYSDISQIGSKILLGASSTV